MIASHSLTARSQQTPWDNPAGDNISLLHRSKLFFRNRMMAMYISLPYQGKEKQCVHVRTYIAKCTVLCHCSDTQPEGDYSNAVAAKMEPPPILAKDDPA